MSERLSTELFVQGHLRQCFARGLTAIVAHKGDAWGGAVLVKLNLLGPGCRLLSQTRDEAGEIAWLQVQKGDMMSEADADAYIARQVARDPDLWVVEIEDKAGRNPFPGKLL
ncbi:hypothetical protein A8950_2876 [Dongia mobilis]|uniref:DUF1491 family protein n=1 Tax=Dongia mobilis TaxID=578943 RepID=A0A4R6WKE8_9PROT|nr:DUF1491 family protein [Dongia mobilis]TDQ81006.1 hypothetical protein A8950_2876 [Dongia mobilis]